MHYLRTIHALSMEYQGNTYGADPEDLYSREDEMPMRTPKI